MIVTYRHRPKPKRSKAQPAKVASAIVTARKPSRYMKRAEPVDDPAADERVRQFYVRMGLGEVYDRTFWTPEQK